MDPWEKHPPANLNDDFGIPYSDIDKKNRLMTKKIACYVENLPHVLVSYDDSSFPVAKCLSCYKNILDNTKIVCDYMNKHNLNDIVYTGFHHGICIIHNQVGVSSKKLQKFNLWVIRDLVQELGPDWLESADQQTEQYATLVFTKS